MNFIHNTWPVVSALIVRDMRVLRSRLLDKCIDGAIQLAIQTLSFGCFFPLLGMPKELIAPMYIGMSFVLYLFFNGYAFSTKIMHLISDHKTTILTYELTLPIDKKWVMVRYIISYIIETLIISVPLMTCGIWILSDIFSNAQGSWFLFYLFYLACLVFSGIFFMLLPFHYSSSYFWNNIWPRRLSWLLNFGALFYTWKGAYMLNPIIAAACLLNPFTYMAEGLRAVLLSGDAYLPASICLIAILCSCIASWQLLVRAIKHRLDPIN